MKAEMEVAVKQKELDAAATAAAAEAAARTKQRDAIATPGLATAGRRATTPRRPLGL